MSTKTGIQNKSEIGGFNLIRITMSTSTLPDRESWVPDPPGDDDGLLLCEEDTIIDECNRRDPDDPRSAFDDVLLSELVRLTPLGDVLRLKLLHLLIIELFLVRSSAPLSD